MFSISDRDTPEFNLLSQKVSGELIWFLSIWRYTVAKFGVGISPKTLEAEIAS